MNRKFFIVSGIVIVSIITIIIGNLQNKNRSNTEGELVSPDSSAFVTLNNKPYAPLGTYSSNETMRESIAYFARQTLQKQYDPAKEPSVSFILSKDGVKKDSVTTFEGKFKKVKDKIAITITELSNEKIKISIVNTKTKTNIDSQLPANSKRNQYIGSLPIKTSDFNISYLKASDAFYVALLGTDIDSGKTLSLKNIQSGIETDALEEETITMIYLNEDGIPITIPNPAGEGT